VASGEQASPVSRSTRSIRARAIRLNRVGGTLRNGQKTGFRLRMTACWRKVDGQWLIEHVSVPVDLEKGKPVLDLAP